MTTMLGIHLRKSKDLTIGKFSIHFFAQLIQIRDLLLAQGQSFFLVISGNIVDINNGVGYFIDREYSLIEFFIHLLQHRIIPVIFFGRNKLFDAGNTCNSHVLSNFHGTCAPWCNHFTTWTYKSFVNLGRIKHFCISEKPFQTIGCFLGKRERSFNSNNMLSSGSEKNDHYFYFLTLKQNESYCLRCKVNEKRTNMRIKISFLYVTIIAHIFGKRKQRKKKCR